MEGQAWFDRLRSALGLGPETRPDPAWPTWYRAYYDLHAIPPTDATPLSELPVVVLDAETTGLDAERDLILSLGGLRVRGNRIDLADKFEAYLPTPAEYADAPAVAVHGIIPNSRRYTYVEEEALLIDLLTYLGDAIVVGHYIGFDVAVIDRALQRHGAGPLRNRVEDTARIAKRLRATGYWTPDREFTLDALARRYRIPLSDRHTALGDCYITAVLWLKLLTRLAEKLNRDLRLADL